MHHFHSYTNILILVLRIPLPNSPHFHPNFLHSHPYPPHSHSESPNSQPDSPHFQPDSPHSHHFLIPFPKSPFRLLQIAVCLSVFLYHNQIHHGKWPCELRDPEEKVVVLKRESESQHSYFSLIKKQLSWHAFRYQGQSLTSPVNVWTILSHLIEDNLKDLIFLPLRFKNSQNGFVFASSPIINDFFVPRKNIQ